MEDSVDFSFLFRAHFFFFGVDGVTNIGLRVSLPLFIVRSINIDMLMVGHV